MNKNTVSHISVLAIFSLFLALTALSAAYNEKRESLCQYFDFESMQDAGEFARLAKKVEPWSASSIEVIDFYTVGIYEEGCRMNNQN